MFRRHLFSTRLGLFAPVSATTCVLPFAMWRHWGLSIACRAPTSCGALLLVDVVPTHFRLGFFAVPLRFLAGFGRPSASTISASLKMPPTPSVTCACTATPPKIRWTSSWILAMMCSGSAYTSQQTLLRMLAGPHPAMNLVHSITRPRIVAAGFTAITATQAAWLQQRCLIHAPSV